MEFKEELNALANKVREQQNMIQTEEAAKNAFIMPFISRVLGYDVFNPLEVVPEFTADVGTKKGEKVDYAIVSGGEVVLLIEAKQPSDDLKIEHASQLFRYFSVTNARIAVLTNGRRWDFYTDLDKPNRMDDKPFLVLDLLNIDETLLPELEKLTSDTFDLHSVISSAEELKWVSALKREIATQMGEPSGEFVRFFTTKVYDGSYTQKIREQFTSLVAKAVKQYVNEQVNGRLKSALGSTEASAPTPPEVVLTPPPIESGVVTTEEELEAYHIVKAIACSEVKPERVTFRDQQSYATVILDNNNRKPIARLWFNAKKQKHLGLFDDAKKETKHALSGLDGIYAHVDEIREAVRRYA